VGSWTNLGFVSGIRSVFRGQSVRDYALVAGV
jgi:hypothetical protein